MALVEKLVPRKLGLRVRSDFERLSFSALVTIAVSRGILSAQPYYVEAWGYNFSGQTDVPPGLTNIIAVAAGSGHALALRSNGTVAAWGNQGAPAGVANLIAIATGSQSIGLKNDGTVLVWGDSDFSVTNVPPNVTNVLAIDAGYNANGARYNLALKGDGTVAVWGNEPAVTNLPVGLNQVVGVAAGSYRCLALKSNGTVVSWGNDTSVPSGLSNVTAVAAGDGHALARKSDGTVVAWGRNDYGQASVPGGLNDVIAIAAGEVHSVALRSNGTVAVWGYNSNGATSIPAGLVGVTAVSAGYQFNVVLTTVPLIRIASQPQSVNTNAGATVTFSVTATCQIPLTYQWQRNGTNLAGQTNTNLVLPNVQVSDAGSYSVVVSHGSASLTSSIATLAVVPPPTIVASPQGTTNHAGGNVWFSATVTSSLPVTYQWLKNGTNLINVNSTTLVLGGWQAADGGTYQLIATSAAGSVTSAPASLTVIDRPAGTVVRMDGLAVPAGLTNIVAVAAGTGYNPAHSVVLHSNGTVVAWGGDPWGFDATVPAGLSNVVAIAAGESFSLALKQNGTITTWGEFPLGPPGGTTNVVAIAARTRSAMALINDGTVVAWGNVPGPPAGLSNVAAIAVGEYSGAAVKNDGTLVVWGSLSWPTALNGLTNVVAVDLNGSGGSPFGLALRNDSTVTLGTVSGLFDSGLTNLPGFSNAVAVSVGNGHGMALRNDSTVLGYGVTPPAGLTNVIAASAGASYTLLLVNSGPVITTHPANLTVSAGENAMFSVVAVGAPTITYQWQKDGTNIAGATNTTLALTNVQPGDAGDYSVVAANSAGLATSVPATLSVTTTPAVPSPPNSETVFTGALVTFSAGAVGALPRTYQWLHNGNILTGATNLNFTLSTTQTGDAGNYSVVVSNSYGVVTSTPAVLTLTTHTFVLPPPGTVVGLGTIVPSGLTNIVGVSAGTGINPPHSLALRSDGTVVAWGGDVWGMDAAVPPGLSNVVAIAAGESFSLALKSDGTTVSWGEAPMGLPANVYGVVAIAAKTRNLVALKADGTVVGGPGGLSNVVAVAAGGYSSAAVKSDNTLVVWGLSALPSLNGLTNVVAADLPGMLSESFGLALRTDTTVTRGTVPNLFDSGLTNLPGFSNVVAISVGNSHGLALKNDTTVLGYGVTLPEGLTNVTAISAGANYSLLITTNPPPPMLLAGGQSASSIALSTPVSVSGYVLEAADDPTGTYTVIETFTNAPAVGATLNIPKDGPKKYYRLRKL